MIADAATYYYLWNAAQALLPVVVGAFASGIVVAWLFWRVGRRRR